MKYGIRGGELEWFRNYMSCRKQRVCLDESRSDWTEVKKGVPQGSILGPLLFLLYVNDLPRTIQNSTVMQYADDTTMTVVAKDAVILERCLEEDVEKVSQWIDRNDLKLNVKKTNLMLIGRKRREKELNEVKVEMRGQLLERSTTVKCLGVFLDIGLT